MSALSAGEIVALANWAQGAIVPRKTWVMDPYAYRLLRWHADDSNARRRHPSKRERREMRTAAAVERRALRTYRVDESPFGSGAS